MKRINWYINVQKAVSVTVSSSLLNRCCGCSRLLLLLRCRRSSSICVSRCWTPSWPTSARPSSTTRCTEPSPPPWPPSTARPSRTSQLDASMLTHIQDIMWNFIVNMIRLLIIVITAAGLSVWNVYYKIIIFLHSVTSVTAKVFCRNIFIWDI